MWIYLPKEDLEKIQTVFSTIAEDERKTAQLFWRPETAEAKQQILDQAKASDAIAEKAKNALIVDPADEPYRAVAQDQAHDELEIDADAVVSAGADPGAWVHAWIWITNTEAGVVNDDKCRDCSEEYAQGGDGYNGRCPDCADKAEKEGRSDD